MWVVYDTESGVEIERIEDYAKASKLVRVLNELADYDHYGKRWED